MSGGQTSEKRAQYNRQYRADPKNRVKTDAHSAVRSAVLRGRIVRQSCEACGAEKTHGHHDDYSRPLDVRWLCHPCHAREHQIDHCGKGHLLEGENLGLQAGKRRCRECDRVRARRYRAVLASQVRRAA